VLLLNPASDWIDSFRERLGRPRPDRATRPRAAPPGADGAQCSAAARAVGSACRRPRCRRCSTASPRGSTKTRETSRYLIGVLVFLGLLGTFYGLLETVRSVGGVIGALNVGASDLTRAFADLKAGLESPLHGMSTAFSSSLVRVGRQPGARFSRSAGRQAQNRFYNDLEEWLSTYTRLSSGPFGDGSDGSMPAYLHALLEQTADSMENLQRIMARGEESRISTNSAVAGLTDRLGVLGENLRAGRR